MPLPTDIQIEEKSGSEFAKWYEEENQKRADLAAASIFQVIAHAIMMALYYDRATDAMSNRDTEIDKQLDFMQKVSDYEFGADLDMLNMKKAVLSGLQIPAVDMCSDVIFCRSEINEDGEAVDLASTNFIDQTCGGKPHGWGTHDGDLYAAKASGYAGGIVANSARREQEDFRQQKTKLVRAGQQGMKALFNAASIQAKYSQAVAIHSGLADLYMQGFNSAGAGLGVALGRMGSATQGTSSFAVGGTAQTASLQTNIGGTSGVVS